MPRNSTPPINWEDKPTDPRGSMTFQPEVDLCGLPWGGAVGLEDGETEYYNEDYDTQWTSS